MAKTKAIKLFSFSLLLLACLPSKAQSEADTTHYAEVRSLVSFYEYMLNSIGSAKSATRDKEVIITESYKKVFFNSEVQIEDDLILDRKVITNKDVSAYLRDVDFFFKEINFDFENIKVEKVEKDDGTYYYLASFESSVSGITIEDNSHLSTKKRFIEVNLTEGSNDLKIVSVYSTKVSREKELQIWWESLSFGWTSIFKDYVPFDSISPPVLLQIAAIDSLNLSENQFIIDIEPLVALKNIKTLDISNSKITDLSPLHYTRGLKKLKANNTPIEDITSLQYFEKLTHLDLSETRITDISTIGRLQQLTSLNLSNTKIENFTPLKQLIKLKSIDLSMTSFSDFSSLSKNDSLQVANLQKTGVNQIFGIQGLKLLKQLTLSETNITSLEGINSLTSLGILSINQTQISQLEPLIDLPNLIKVYADLTGITDAMASSFMMRKPSTVVVTNSEEVMEWWNALSGQWKIAFSEITSEDNLNKEGIIKLRNRDSLNLSGMNLNDGAPLSKFAQLKYLDISKNQFTNFEFTAKMSSLVTLKGTDLPVEGVSGLEKNANLRSLDLQGSSLDNIRSLYVSNQLELLNIDNTNVDDAQIVKYLESNPQTVIIYQSELLKHWWDNLAQQWQDALNITEADSHHLHQLIEQKEITISNQPITSLNPLYAFINLEKVTLDKVSVNNFNDLYEHKNLKHLNYTNGPLQTLEGITQLEQLESLNISNTAIEDLKDLRGLNSLKHLNCAGTGIKNLSGIDELYELESLDISNTRIWKLERLYEMQNLKSLVCNNTRLRTNTIDDFKVKFPDCQITFY